MQHNIKKIKEVLVPYTAEENAELSGGEDTVPPPLSPYRPNLARGEPEAPDAPDAAAPQRTPQTEAEGTLAMKAYKEAWEKANAEAANRPITLDNPAGARWQTRLLTLASVSWYVHGHGVLAGRAPLSTGVPPIERRQPEFRLALRRRRVDRASPSSSSRRPTSSSASAQTTS